MDHLLVCSSMHGIAQGYFYYENPLVVREAPLRWNLPPIRVFDKFYELVYKKL